MTQTITEYETQVDRHDEEELVKNEIARIIDISKRYGWDFDRSYRFRKSVLSLIIDTTESEIVRKEMQERLSII